LGAPVEELEAPHEGEVYVHELEGFSVRQADGTALGLVSGLYDLPSGLTLEVQGPRREFLLPFKKEFVREVRREDRVLVVTLPEGLLEL
jgi:16S rRNA processing protein RimM